MTAIFHPPDTGSNFPALRLPLYVPAAFFFFFPTVPANVDLLIFAPPPQAQLEWQVKNGEWACPSPVVWGELSRRAAGYSHNCAEIANASLFAQSRRCWFAVIRSALLLHRLDYSRQRCLITFSVTGVASVNMTASF